MIILPAIDIKDGECVRLYKGVMSTAEVVADDALATAAAFKDAGAEWVHMVDLNGAVEGVRVNSGIFIDVAQKSGLKVELGGGIRRLEDIDYYLDKGIGRVVIGSAAVTNPELVEEAVKKYGEKIAVGIDAKKGRVAVSGWTTVSEIDFITMAQSMEAIGVSVIIYTDIDRDGMLSGPNIEQLNKINQSVSCDIIASGGINDINDIVALRDCGFYGAICGRSLYKGTLNLEEAVKVGGNFL